MADILEAECSVKNRNVYKLEISNDLFTLEVPEIEKTTGLPISLYLNGQRYYFVKNTEKSKQKRKDINKNRYHSDPEFRQKMIDNAIQYQKQKRLEKQKKIENI